MELINILPAFDADVNDYVWLVFLQLGGKFGELLLNKTIAHLRLHVGFGLKARDEHHFAYTVVDQISKANKALLLFDCWDDGLFGNLNGFLHLCWLYLPTRDSCVHMFAPF